MFDSAVSGETFQMVTDWILKLCNRLTTIKWHIRFSLIKLFLFFELTPKTKKTVFRFQNSESERRFLFLREDYCASLTIDKIFLYLLGINFRLKRLLKWQHWSSVSICIMTLNSNIFPTNLSRSILKDSLFQLSWKLPSQWKERSKFFFYKGNDHIMYTYAK